MVEIEQANPPQDAEAARDGAMVAANEEGYNAGMETEGATPLNPYGIGTDRGRAWDAGRLQAQQDKRDIRLSDGK